MRIDNVLPPWQHCGHSVVTVAMPPAWSLWQCLLYSQSNVTVTMPLESYTHAHTHTHTTSAPHLKELSAKALAGTLWLWQQRCWQEHSGTEGITAQSCHTYEWVMSHIWMSHVTHLNESCHTYECVMSERITAQVLAGTLWQKHTYKYMCVFVFTYVYLDTSTLNRCHH